MLLDLRYVATDVCPLSTSAFWLQSGYFPWRGLFSQLCLICLSHFALAVFLISFAWGVCHFLHSDVYLVLVWTCNYYCNLLLLWLLLLVLLFPFLISPSINKKVYYSNLVNLFIILITFMQSYCLQKFLNRCMFFSKTFREETYTLITLKFLSMHKFFNLL